MSNLFSTEAISDQGILSNTCFASLSMVLLDLGLILHVLSQDVSRSLQVLC